MSSRNLHPRLAGQTAAPNVLVLDAGEGFALPVIRCLGAAGMKVDVATTSSRVDLRYSRYTSSFNPLASSTQRDLLQELIGVLLLRKPDVLLPADLGSARFVVAHHEQLSAHTTVVDIADEETFEAASNKWELAKILNSASIAHPATALGSAGGEHSVDSDHLQPPLLVKPVDGSNGRGISVVSTMPELEADLVARPSGEQVVIQKFVEGFDIDCSVLCRDGEILAYTIQRGWIEEPGRYSPPKGINFVHDDRIRTVVERLVDRLQWSGIAHIDLRVDDQTGKAVVIEINPRYWASLLGSLRAGVNFPQIAVRAALYGPVTAPTFRECSYLSMGGVAVLARSRRFADIKIRDSSLRYLLVDPRPELRSFRRNSVNLRGLDSA